MKRESTDTAILYSGLGSAKSLVESHVNLVCLINCYSPARQQPTTFPPTPPAFHTSDCCCCYPAWLCKFATSTAPLRQAKHVRVASESWNFVEKGYMGTGLAFVPTAWAAYLACHSRQDGEHPPTHCLPLPPPSSAACEMAWQCSGRKQIKKRKTRAESNCKENCIDFLASYRVQHTFCSHCESIKAFLHAHLAALSNCQSSSVEVSLYNNCQIVVYFPLTYLSDFL